MATQSIKEPVPHDKDPHHNCQRCPRLATFIADHRKKEPDWFNGPVPTFGDSNARIMIVGLAPGLKGANRTGRPFTGDYAGDLLYSTLDKFGFSQGTYQKHVGDGLKLKDITITNAVRCVPPQNKPTGPEIQNCRPFLQNTIAATTKHKGFLVLGRIAHDTVLRNLSLPLKAHPFAHGAVHEMNNGYWLFDSYHCSRYNTNTGRLTEAMFESVFETMREKLNEPRSRTS